MALNINTAYLQYWEDFSLLGKSMRKFSIACWITVSTTIIGSFIIFISFMIPLLGIGYNSADEFYALLIGIGGISLFIFLIIVLIGIYQFVTHIQYLIQLKKFSTCTGDLNLKKAYVMELWAIIISILMFFTIITGLIIFFFLMGSVEYLGSEAALDLFILMVFLMVLFIVVTLTSIFQILSTTAFDKWSHIIKLENFQNPITVKIADGTNFMKNGRSMVLTAPFIMLIVPIIGIFTFLIGLVLFQIGLMKTGKKITEFFDGYGNYQSTQGAAFQQSSSGSTLQQPVTSTINPNLNSISMGNPSFGNTTMKPLSVGFCPFCGSKLLEKNSMFCPNCGRKLQ